MPTISRIPGPYRLFFYSFDCNERVHVHARRDDATCKFWLDPVALVTNRGFSARDLAAVRRIILQHTHRILEAWRSTAAQHSNDPRVRTVEVTDDLITAHLSDGRTISVPLA